MTLTSSCVQVVELKSHLQSRGLRTSGLKEELVARLKAADKCEKNRSNAAGAAAVPATHTTPAPRSETGAAPQTEAMSNTPHRAIKRWSFPLSVKHRILCSQRQGQRRLAVSEADDRAPLVTGWVAVSTRACVFAKSAEPGPGTGWLWPGCARCAASQLDSARDRLASCTRVPSAQRLVAR